MIRKLLIYIPLVLIAWFILSGVAAVYYVANSNLSTDFKDGQSFTVYPFVIQDSAAKYANSHTRTCTLYGITIVEMIDVPPMPTDMVTPPANTATPTPTTAE